MSGDDKVLERLLPSAGTEEEAPTTVAALEVRDLTKDYGEVRALKGVSFSVPAGQVCGYLGPNGAGKSTTMRILAGILKAGQGEVRILGHDLGPDSLEARRVTAYVPESGALYSLLSAREYLSLVADLYELDEDLAAERTGLLFDLFGFAEVADRRIDTLSRGQRQKVVLASALIHDPQLLLLDEPLTGLDVTAARTVKRVIQGLVQRGRTVLFSSHILDVVERVCDRAIIIDRGEIVADAPTRELMAKAEDESLESVFHGLVRSEDVEGLAGAFLDTVDQAASEERPTPGRRRRRRRK